MQVVVILNKFSIGLTLLDLTTESTKEWDTGERLRFYGMGGGYSRVRLHIISFMRIECSIQCMANSSLAIWKFLEFFLEYFQSAVGWICRSQTHEYEGQLYCEEPLFTSGIWGDLTTSGPQAFTNKNTSTFKMFHDLPSSSVFQILFQMVLIFLSSLSLTSLHWALGRQGKCSGEPANWNWCLIIWFILYFLVVLT